MGSRAGDGRSVGQSLVEALGPVFDIILVDRAALGWSSLLGLDLGHCDCRCVGRMFRVVVRLGDDERIDQRNDLSE